MATRLLNLRVRVQPYLAALRARETTNREIAVRLGCNEQALSRLLGTLGFEREAAIDRAAISRASKERRASLAVLANTMSPEAAAAAAGVSLRTVYRYISK